MDLPVSNLLLFRVGVGLVMLALAGLAIALVRIWVGGRHDHFRTLYQCHFPTTLPHAQFLGFIRSLSGLPTVRMLKPAETIVFERYGRGSDIRYYLSVPDHLKMDVEALYHGHIKDGMLVETQDDLTAEIEWDDVSELTLPSGYIPLDIDSPEAAITNVLAGFAHLTDEQAVLTQWAIVPARTPALPSSDKTSWPRYTADPAQAKAKFSEPVFLATGRLATAGRYSQRLMRRHYTGLHTMKARGLKFRKRFAPASSVRERIRRRSGAVWFPCVLNASELSVLTAPQVDGVTIGGLSKVSAMPPHKSIPETGIGLAMGNYPGLQRPLGLTQKALTHHLWITGPTGSGKSVLLHNTAVQMMEQGMGLVLIEPKGDLARDVLKSVPHSRIKDVIWFDPTDTDFPIGLNVLAGPDPERTTGNIVSLFKNLYGDSWGSRLERILRYSVLTAAQAGLTLYDVKQLLTNPDFRNRIVRTIKDPEVRQFWRWLDDSSDTFVDSVVNKLDGFLGSRAIRNIVGQKTGLDMESVVRDHKILIMPLENARLGEANAAMLGSLVVAQLWQYIRLRPLAQRYPVALMMDEFQNYVGYSVGMESLFAEARSYQLPLVVANQHVSQLGSSVLSAVKSDARTKVAFTMDPDDAKKLKDYYAPMTPDQLEHLPQFTIAVRAMTDAGVAPVATATTYPPPMPTGAGDVALAASRQSYGRPVATVEAEFAEAHKPNEPKRRPKIGREDDSD